MAAEQALYRGIDSDYPGRMQTLSKDVATLLHKPHAQLLFGPTYHIATSKNTPVHIHSFVVQYKNDFGENRKGYYLLAQDDNGRIVGHANGDFALGRTSLLSKALYGKEEVFVMGSMLATAFRGEGFAVPLSLARQDFLQREADNLGVPVTMIIVDANIVALQEARRMVREHPDNQRLRELLALKEAEHRRWEQLWVDGQHVRFTPRRQTRRHVEAGEIYLSRKETVRGIVPQIEKEVEDTRTPQQKQAEFQKVMQAVEELAAAA